MTQKHNELSNSDCEHPLLPCNEEPGRANQLIQELNLICVNADGLKDTKVTYLLSLTSRTKISVFQQLHNNVFEKLERRASVSPTAGWCSFLNPNPKVEGVAAFLSDELASQVTDLRLEATGS
eukprot:snap_masked-scaffold_5-processed-gene-12.29-mRNA-1 protein AED:1.00 eAED:1.00 QI:0/-1/0/0/-1/1/1/0/122